MKETIRIVRLLSEEIELALRDEFPRPKPRLTYPHIYWSGVLPEGRQDLAALSGYQCSLLFLAGPHGFAI